MENGLTAAVKDLYQQIDDRILNNRQNSIQCKACGKCCNFPSFGHKLYLTTPEIIYFASSAKCTTLRKMDRGICPYNIEGKCTVYPFRFTGCRIFTCGASEDFQSDLSEWSITILKGICADFKIPYHYAELSRWLNWIGNQYLSTGKGI